MRLSHVALLLFVVVLVAGCGPKGPAVNYVEGTVTFDGKPLDKAQLFFHPQDGGLPATGMTDANGKYKLTSLQGGGVGKGATAGDFVVAITRWTDEPSRIERDRASGESMAFFDSVIPERYTTQHTTPLTFTVVTGKNRFDIDIDKQ